MAIEIIRADGTRDEDSFVVIKSIDPKGNVLDQKVIKDMQFYLEVDGYGAATVQVQEVGTDGL